MIVLILFIALLSVLAVHLIGVTGMLLGWGCLICWFLLDPGSRGGR
jgi:hypothetical protein